LVGRQAEHPGAGWPGEGRRQREAETRGRAHGPRARQRRQARRRSRGARRPAWVLAAPQPILGEVAVTLPSTHAAAVTVTLADGTPAKQARLKLLLGAANDGAAAMAMFG